MTVPTFLKEWQIAPEALRKVPGLLVRVPKNERIPFLEQHGEDFAEGLKIFPNAIHYVPSEYQKVFLKKYRAQFGEGLKRQPSAIMDIPAELRADIVKEYRKNIEEAKNFDEGDYYKVKEMYPELFQENKTVKAIHECLREMVATEALGPGHFIPTIFYYEKSNYGNEPAKYVADNDPHKRALEILTGKKTIIPRHEEALIALGFVFHKRPHS